jgi:hypothetical protein
MISALGRGKEGNQDFTEAHPLVINLSRQILKREEDKIQPT